MNKELDHKRKMLVKIADLLDKSGDEDAADFIDGLIGEMNEGSQEPPTVELEIPDDERDELEQVYRALGDSLGF